jgi:hypothetical protein
VSSGAAQTESPAGGAYGFNWKDFIVPVIGAVGLIIGFFYIWSEYSFQQEKVDGSALVLQKFSKKATSRSWRMEYYLLCRQVAVGTQSEDSPSSSLMDSYNHWQSVREGDTVQITFRKGHPTDMRLVSGGILESPNIGLESWGLWSLVIGLIASWVGWRPLAVPLFRWLRQRMGVVKVSS